MAKIVDKDIGLIGFGLMGESSRDLILKQTASGHFYRTTE